MIKPILRKRVPPVFGLECDFHTKRQRQLLISGAGAMGSPSSGQSLIFSLFAPGQLLLSLEDLVEVLFRSPGGGFHVTIHQPLWEQPPCSLLRGISHTLVHGRALPLHPAGGVWGPVGNPLHPLQHRLVQEA